MHPMKLVVRQPSGSLLTSAGTRVEALLPMIRQTTKVGSRRAVLTASAIWLAVSVLAAMTAAQTHLFTFRGKTSDHWLGHAASGAGDVNGDGFADLLVGISGNTNSDSTFGSVWVISGREGRVLHTVHGTQPGDTFGWAVSKVGDLDRDGRPDFAVGAPGPEGKPGYVQIFSGRTGQVLFTFRGTNADDRFGWSVAGVLDLDRDGHPDVAVGALLGGDMREGTVTAFSGRDGHAIHRFRGVARYDYFGWSLCGPGDVNGDGFPDLVVGAPGIGLPPSSAYVRVISGRDGSVLKICTDAEYSVSGTVGGSDFGASVAGAGDMDGDGDPDFAVGATGRNSSESGFVAIIGNKKWYALAPTGPPLPAFGATISALGDVTGDGISDFVVGAPADSSHGPHAGSVWVFSGGEGAMLWSFRGDAPGVRLGASVSGCGDVNRDGIPDVCIGALQLAQGSTGYVTVHSGRRLPFTADRHALALASGGRQALQLAADADLALRPYHVLGSFSGTAPGVRLGPQVLLPLNMDAYLLLTALHPTAGWLTRSVGALDHGSRATAVFVLPAGMPASLSGVTLHHAFVLFGDGVVFASNPVPLMLVP